MRISTIVCILFIEAVKCCAQSFINLDFETALIRTNGAPQGMVVANSAIPGWIAYVNGVPSTYIWYSGASLGAAAVTLEPAFGSFTPVPQVQSNYYVYLQGSSDTPQHDSAAIGQTGQIPLSAQSIIFWGNDVLNITFAGQALSFNQTGSSAYYNIYAADISAFAGQTGQLLFTAGAGTAGYFDNIQFSSNPVPEPTTLGLLAMAGGLVGLCNRRRLS